MDPLKIIIPGATPGTYVERDGTIIDLINPLTRPANESGSIAKFLITALIVKMVS